MSLTSYSQNGEDIILYRALSHIKKGFYIDIGACDPVDMSVTKLFYDAGWTGVNFEPDEIYYNLLLSHRKKDTNLPFIVSNEKGFSTFYTVSKKGLSTADEVTASIYSKEKLLDVTAQKRRRITLNEIFSSYVDSEVHFLKIDVEGYETQVVQGNNWESNRPWIVVIESTIPNSPVSSYKEWEPILLEADYVFCYFDGLNRYYVVQEKEELKEKLAIQPNVFDRYLRYDHRKAISENQRLVEKLEVLDELIIHLGELESETDACKKEIWKLESKLEKSNKAIAELKQYLPDIHLEIDQLKNKLTIRHILKASRDKIYKLLDPKKSR